MNFNRMVDYIYNDLPNGGKQSAYIGTQFIFYFIVFLCVVSTAAFFHFQLNHSLSIIEDWLRLNGWKTLIISKAVSFFVIFKFLIIRFNVKESLRSLVLNTMGKFEASFFVLVFTNYFLMIYLTGPISQEQLLPSFNNQLLIFISTVFVFSLDIIFIILIDRLYPLENRFRFFRDIAYASFWCVLYKASLQIEGSSVRFVFFQLFLILQILHWHRLNWLHPLLYITMVVAPLQAWFGLDMILKGEFSSFVPSRDLHWIELLSILIIYIVYFRLTGVRNRGFN